MLENGRVELSAQAGLNKLVVRPITDRKRDP